MKNRIYILSAAMFTYTITFLIMVLFPLNIFASAIIQKDSVIINMNLFVVIAVGLIIITALFNYLFLKYHLKKNLLYYKQTIANTEEVSAVENIVKEDNTEQINNTRDILTNLPNRKQLYAYLHDIIANKNKKPGKVAILITNLDFFRSVNNNLGHEVGDKIIQECAARLQTLYQDNSFLARMDGDEFAVVIKTLNTEDLFVAANNLHEEFKKPMQIVNQEIYLSASTGISVFPDQGDSASELIKNATTALYVVKNSSRNSYKVYAPEIKEYNHQKFNLHSELHHAVKNNEFVLHYQPKIDGKTSQIVGIEALVRWNHPNRGLLYPIDFIPIAEETGIIKHIDEWVLYTACTQLKKWLREGMSDIRLAVNLSAWQFKDQYLADTVIKVLERTGISPSCLELEITETAAVENLSFTQNTLSKLMDIGVSISIDDFGTGYSSLSYLKHFPVNFLKIDRSFVADMLSDKNTYSIIRAIIDIAHALQLKVIAEGVENQAQLDMLMNLGCDEIQGYHISRPLNVEDIKKQLKI